MSGEVVYTVRFGDKIVDVKGAPGMTPEQLEAGLQKQLAAQEQSQAAAAQGTSLKDKVQYGLDEAEKVLGQSLQGALMTSGLAGDAAVGIPNFVARKTGFLEDIPANTPGPQGYMPWPSDVLMNMSRGKYSPEADGKYAPESGVGKTLGNIGESIVAALSLGPTKAALATGFGGGVGGEVAAKAIDDNPLTRIIGSIVGGGIPAYFKAGSDKATERIRAAFKHIDPSKEAEALAKEAFLRDNNIPYSSTQLFGQANTLPDLFQRASSNEYVRPQVLEKLGSAGDKALEAIRAWQARSMLPTATSTRANLGDIQQTAFDAITQSKKYDTKLYDRAYDARLAKIQKQPSADVKAAESVHTQHKLALEPQEELFQKELAAYNVQKAAYDKAVKAGGSPAAPVEPTPSPELLALRKAEVTAKANLDSAQQRLHATTNIPEAAWQTLDNYLAQEIAKAPKEARIILQDLRGRLSRGKDLIPVLDGKILNSEFTSLANKLEAATHSANPIAAGTAKHVQGIIAQARATLGKAFEPVQAANAAWLLRKENRTVPLINGLTGDLAYMGGGPKDRYTATESAITRVFSNTRSQAKEIDDLAAALKPDKVSSLLQEHFARAQASAYTPTANIAEAIQQPFALQAAYRGGKNSPLRANVDAGLRAAASTMRVPAAQLQKSFHQAMDSLETYRDLKLASMTDSTTLRRNEQRSDLATLIAPVKTAYIRALDKALASTHKKLVELALHPDGAKLLIAIGRSKDPSVLPAFAVTLVDQATIGADAANSPEITEK